MTNSTWLQVLLLSQWAIGVCVEWLLIALVVIALGRLTGRAITYPSRAYRRRTAARRAAPEQPAAAPQ